MQWKTLEELLLEQDMFGEIDKTPKNEHPETVREVKRLVGYLCVYMYMLYCEADRYAKQKDREKASDSMMDPSYIGSKIAYFLRWVKEIWIDTFSDIASSDVRAWEIYKHIDIGVWTVDYCKQNYPQRLQDFIDKNPELKSMFPEDVRDENWMLV